MAPKRRCPVCGSRQWHKEPSSGLIACSEGHVLQNYRNEATEAEDMGSQHVLKKRTIKSGKKNKGRQSRANPELYHGIEGRHLYFQCQQYILRKQIATVTQLWSLPPEFEMICRDIWMLHLSMLSDPVPEDPFLEVQSDRSTRNTRPESSSPSSSEEDDQTREEDPELAELLRQNSEASSQEESGDEQPITNATSSPRTRGHSKNEGPAMNLAVLMVALWTMRIPVLYRDFVRHIELYDLPYLDPVRLLPKDMILHLTKHNIHALSPAHAPDTINLHKLTSRLAKKLFLSYNVVTPEANAAPILWRVIQGLGGTPTLYRLTKRLSQRLSLPLALHSSLVPGLKQFKLRDPEHHKYDNAPVEISFLAAAIIVLKLVYGLDGRTRVPASTEDPACGLPRIEDYLKAVEGLREADVKKDSVFSSEGCIAVEDLDNETVESYLTFCERILPSTDDHKILTEHFPVPQPVHVNYDETATEGGSGGCGHSPGDDNDDSLRPGEKYRIYVSRDVLGSVEEELEAVMRRGWEWGGVKKEYMYQLVEVYERRLVRN